MTSPGKVLNGRYRLERRLGGGTMGTVWEAFDIHLERTVAVKELIPGPFADEDAATRRERVKREATALAQVEHPVIVTVHDLISVGRSGVPWIVMGYVPGRPLSEIIGEQKDAPLPEQKIAAIALAVLDGLRACHTSLATRLPPGCEARKHRGGAGWVGAPGGLRHRADRRQGAADR